MSYNHLLCATLNKKLMNLDDYITGTYENDNPANQPDLTEAEEVENALQNVRDIMPEEAEILENYISKLEQKCKRKLDKK